MKSRMLYVSLVGGIVILIVAAAFLTQRLFSLTVDDEPSLTPGQAVEAAKPSGIAETVIDVGAEPASADAAPRLAASPTPASPRARPAQPVDVPPPAPGVPGIGTAAAVRGTIVATLGEETRLLAHAARVHMGEAIEAGPGARLQIQFDDGSTLSLGENSRVILDTYLYNPRRNDDCTFGIRIVRGACRIVTGWITKLNPERFSVHTRTATVGIRGCDVAFRSSVERDDVMVLDLAGIKLVRIDTTKDGSPVNDLSTGKPVDVPAEKRQTIDIVDPGRQVSIVPGQGASQRPMTQNDIRGLAAETSFLPPARHDLDQKPDGATVSITPERAQPATARP